MTRVASEAGSSSDDGVIQDNGLISNTTVPQFEALQLYRRNYFHPVHLHNVLDKRYKVLHKLGQGSTATVWLCHDLSPQSQTKYVAVKIHTAIVSEGPSPDLEVEKLILPTGRQYHCLSLDQFRFDGPNGQHFAAVYPVHGPCANNLPHLLGTHNIGRTLRKMCQAVIRGIAILHENDICHSDIRPDNILAQLNSLDQFSELSIKRIFGKPETVRVLTVSGDPHNRPSAPQYLVEPVVWNDMNSELHKLPIITDRISICDFGSCFKSTTNTPRESGVCPWYASPEYMLGSKASVSSDMWALACTIFEIRTGRPLFATKGQNYDRDEQLCEIVWVLGPLPEPMWSTLWQNRRKFFRDKPDTNGNAVPMIKPDTTAADTRPRSIPDRIAPGLLYNAKGQVEDLQRGIELPERQLLADLLLGLLKYQPGDRLSAREAFQHPWFLM